MLLREPGSEYRTIDSLYILNDHSPAAVVSPYVWAQLALALYAFASQCAYVTQLRCFLAHGDVKGCYGALSLSKVILLLFLYIADSKNLAVAELLV